MKQTRPITPLRKTRGRPKRTLNENTNQPDLGTPELIMKRAQSATAEAIDQCLHRDIINKSQHRCALHLRWLHTIRYGAPSVTALDLTRGIGTELYDEDDHEWRTNREQDYAEAILLLRQHRHDRDLLPCIIYNDSPIFLRPTSLKRHGSSLAQAEHIQHAVTRFIEGLELLKEHWKR